MSYPVQVHPYHPRCQGKDHHGQECVDRSCLPLVNPGPLVCDGEVDQALAVEGAQDTQQGGLPQEPVESHAHARKRTNGDPEAQEQGEHAEVHILKEDGAANHISNNLTDENN